MPTTFLEKAGAWFLRSGIRYSNGGVARYYRSDLRQNAPISNEITGYTVSTLAFLYQRTGQAEYKEGVRQSACFLVNSAWDEASSIFPFEHPANGLAYFFDCGIMVRGLLAAWRLEGTEAFLQAAIQGGRAMLADFRAGDAFAPIISLPDKKVLPYEQRWSATPGCYQLKAALAWRDLAEVTGAAEFLQAYEGAVGRALRDAESFLPGASESQTVMDRLHPCCYFLEGLLPVVQRPECAAAYRLNLNRVDQILRQIEPEFVRSDVYAQLLRARLYGHALGVVPLDPEAATREAERAAAFQLTSADARIDGGFGFGRKENIQLPYLNPVSTAFCVQALALWADYRNGALAPTLDSLI